MKPEDGPVPGESVLGYVRRVVESRKDSECWFWPCAISGGYGNLWVNGKTRKAYQVAYELRYGSVPPGLELDHTCHTKSCWNPDHVEPVTHQVNMRRVTWPQSLKTECPRGHPYTDENTYWIFRRNGKTVRTCRTCKNLHWQAWQRGERLGVA